MANSLVKYLMSDDDLAYNRASTNVTPTHPRLVRRNIAKLTGRFPGSQLMDLYPERLRLVYDTTDIKRVRSGLDTWPRKRGYILFDPRVDGLAFFLPRTPDQN
jgi:hypothetical protein